MNTSDTLVIDTKRLSKSYNGVMALKSLDLQVSGNSIFGFLGPNGAGKTTTIKLLLGLIRPTNGGGVFSFMESLMPYFLSPAGRLVGVVPISEGELKDTLGKSSFSIQSFIKNKLLPVCFVRATKKGL